MCLYMTVVSIFFSVFEDNSTLFRPFVFHLQIFSLSYWHYVCVFDFNTNAVRSPVLFLSYSMKGVVENKYFASISYSMKIQSVSERRL